MQTYETVTYKEVAAAKQRLWNKEQKLLRRNESGQHQNLMNDSAEADRLRNDRKMGSPLSGWMKQHVRLVEASMTMVGVAIRITFLMFEKYNI